MADKTHRLPLFGIVLGLFAGEAVKQKVPRRYFVIGRPSQQIYVLELRYAFTHELQYVRVEALYAGEIARIPPRASSFSCFLVRFDNIVEVE